MRLLRCMQLEWLTGSLQALATGRPPCLSRRYVDCQAAQAQDLIEKEDLDLVCKFFHASGIAMSRYRSLSIRLQSKNSLCGSRTSVSPKLP